MKKNKNDNKFYSGAKAVLGPALRFFMYLKPHGVENVPQEGGIILCSNHISALDVISIGAVCPRQLTFVAKKELFSVPVIGWLVKKLGAIRIDRGGKDVGAIKASVNAAVDGKVLSTEHTDYLREMSNTVLAELLAIKKVEDLTNYITDVKKRINDDAMLQAAMRYADILIEVEGQEEKLALQTLPAVYNAWVSANKLVTAG